MYLYLACQPAGSWDVINLSGFEGKIPGQSILALLVNSGLTC